MKNNYKVITTTDNSSGNIEKILNEMVSRGYELVTIYNSMLVFKMVNN